MSILSIPEVPVVKRVGNRRFQKVAAVRRTAVQKHEKQGLWLRSALEHLDVLYMQRRDITVYDERQWAVPLTDIWVPVLKAGPRVGLYVISKQALAQMDKAGFPLPTELHLVAGSWVTVTTNLSALNRRAEVGRLIQTWFNDELKKPWRTENHPLHELFPDYLKWAASMRGKEHISEAIEFCLYGRTPADEGWQNMIARERFIEKRGWLLHF